MIAEQLFDKVYYYKNVIDDPKNVISLLEKTESDEYSKVFSKWNYWGSCSGKMYEYGSQKKITYLNKHEISERVSGEELDNTLYLVDQIFGGMERVCKDYASKLNDESRLLLMQNVEIKKYETGTFMGAHYDQQEGDQRLKYSLVMYLNDDYEGGELSFNVKDGIITGTENAAREDFTDPNNNDKIMFHIKPEAGSVIIFPSTSPYNHTAHLVKSGFKYMVPGFWMNTGKYVKGTFYPD